MPVLIILFLIWGFLMYRLWTWMESGTKKESVLDYCFRLSYNFRKICVKTLILDESFCCMEKRIFTVGKRF
jgi:hypothetical protein